MWQGRLIAVLIVLMFVFAIILVLGTLFRQIDSWTAF
jgi:hypothetical protein